MFHGDLDPPNDRDGLKLIFADLTCKVRDAKLG